MNEQDLKALAERAFNPLIPMDPVAREDLKKLMTYVGGLRKRIQFMHEELEGARATLMVVCQRADNKTLRVPDIEVQMLDPQDRLVVDNEEDVDGKIVKVFRYESTPRIIQ